MVVVWITGAAVLFVLFLLAVPLAARLTGDAAGLHGEILWLYGTVRFPLSNRGETKSAGRTEHSQKKRKKKGGKTTPSGITPSDISAALKVIVTLTRRILTCFSVDTDGELQFGLDDPADTGILWGSGYPALQWIIDRTGLRIVPSFHGATLRFDGTATVRTVPLTLVIPVLQAILSREGRRVIRSIRSRR